ncbi:hypothetical protein BDQ17DRAFT_313287 [Cyathus striatus]|nr:hypothetical protein BDQ17DRAFT_313287 [Cyathus striatus]
MDSPFQQYLGTNYMSTVDEAKHIQDLLEISGQNLLCIDTEIDQVQRQLDLLQEKRSGIHDFAEQHRALLSPARKLTQDIVEEIFIACLPEDRNSYMNSMEDPMLLTQICSSWRRIALSTPRIWSAIHIVLPNIIIGKYSVPNNLLKEEELVLQTLDRQQAAVKERLDRSGACPLSISICQTPDPSFLIHNNAEVEAHYDTKQRIRLLHQQFFRDTIIPYHQRWYNLDVSFFMDTLQGSLLEIGLKTEDLKMLKEFHITRLAHHRSEQPICQWKDIIALFSLTVTSATFYNIPTHSSDIYSVPLYAGWGRLTELSLHLDQDLIINPNLVDFASAIISHCQLLKTLKLGIFFFGHQNDSSPHSGEDITLHHLTTLSLTAPASIGVLNFSKRLYLPSIKELNIQVHKHYSDDVFGISEGIVNSLLRIHGGCRSLVLHIPDWLNSVDNLVQVLKSMPCLKYLKVSLNNINNFRWAPWPGLPIQARFKDIINDDLLHALTPLGKEYSDIICPQLEGLECDNSILTGITESTLKDFVKARKGDQRISSLRRISLFINDFKSKEDPKDEKLSLGTDSAVFFRKPAGAPRILIW